jgi:hypothetical protein
MMMVGILAGQRTAQAQTATLNSPSASDLQTLLQNGQTGRTNVIILNFTNTLVTTTPLFVTFPNTLLIASNANTVFFSGNNTSQVIYVEAGVRFTMQNVTISGGKSTGLSGVNGTNGSSGGSSGANGTAGTAGTGGLGGAIYNNGNTTLIGCSLLTNTAAGGNGGSGGGGGNGSNFGGNGGSGGSGGAGYGGAVYNLGTLTLSNCTVAGNTATGGNGGSGGTNGSGSFAYSGAGGAGALGAGGGVFNAAGAVLNVTNCTFNNNLSQGGTSQAAGGAPDNGSGQTGLTGADAEGAGIQNLGTSKIVNSTFFQNTVTGGNGGNGGNATTGAFAGAGGDGGNAYGGGIFNSSAGFVAVTNCTFYGGIAIGGTNGVPGAGSHTNSIGSPGVGYGANVVNNGGTFKIKNSLFSGPVGASNAYYATTAFTDQDNNITSDNTPEFTQTNSFIYTFPKLILPGFNGGPTETMALQPGSPAINRVFDGSAPPFDQRGVRRPLGKRPCSGAFEFGSVTYTISGQILPPTNAYTNVTIVAQGTDFSYSTQPDSNGNYTFHVAAETYNIIPQPTNGFIFNPPSSNSITVGTTNEAVSNVDFTATAVFDFGGVISNVNSAVTVTILNNNTQLSGQTTTDTNGFFIFTNLVADNYTITPQSAIYNFAPPNVTTNLTSTDTNFDVFVASGAKFQIQGQVSNANGGIVITASANGGVNTTTTTAFGFFIFTNLLANTYTIAPVPTNGVAFSPQSASVTVPPNGTANFTAQFLGSGSTNISGQISNVPAPVTINAVSGTNVVAQTKTDTNGVYNFANLPAGSYTLSPVPTNGVSFSPATLPAFVPPGTNANFAALGTISVQITNVHTPVTIDVNNGSSDSFYLSSTNGSIAISNLPADTYTVRLLPTNGISFTPSVQNVTVPPGGIASFTAIMQPTITGLVTTNQTIQFSVSGVSNLNYLIQASTNLSSPSNWVTIATNNSGTSGAFTFTNSITNAPQRFFRVTAP